MSVPIRDPQPENVTTSQLAVRPLRPLSTRTTSRRKLHQPPVLSSNQHLRYALLPPYLWEEDEDTLMQVMQDIGTYLGEAHYRRNPDTTITVTQRDSNAFPRTFRESNAFTRRDGITTEASRTPSPEPRRNPKNKNKNKKKTKKARKAKEARPTWRARKDRSLTPEPHYYYEMRLLLVCIPPDLWK